MWRGTTRSPTRTDISVSVPVAILGMFCHLVRALMGLIPDFLKQQKQQQQQLRQMQTLGKHYFHKDLNKRYFKACASIK